MWFLGELGDFHYPELYKLVTGKEPTRRFSTIVGSGFAISIPPVVGGCVCVCQWWDSWQVMALTNIRMVPWWHL